MTSHELGGQRPSPRGMRRSTLILLGGLATALTAFAVIAISLAAGRSDRPASTRPATPPAAAVARVHAVLHEMGRLCTANATEQTRQQIGRDVNELIQFARLYPTSRFTVDDESGSAPDLLLIASTEMRRCAPAAAERANRAVPPQYREPAPTAGTS